VLELLARLHIREGIPLCVSVMELDRWNGGYYRLPRCAESLRRYRVHAMEVLPQLREILRQPGEGKKDLGKLIADIEASTDSPTLVDLKDFIAQASAKVDTSNNIKKATP
jgi:hypothetical protein